MTESAEQIIQKLKEIVDSRIPAEVGDSNQCGECGSYHAENGATYVRDQIRLAMGWFPCVPFSKAVHPRRNSYEWDNTYKTICKNCGRSLENGIPNDPCPKPPIDHPRTQGE